MTVEPHVSEHQQRSESQEPAAWSAGVHRELTGNILPFWIRHTVDHLHGGFHGRVDCAGNVDAGADRSAVLHTRILWTYSAAARLLGGDEYRRTADHAFRYLVERFRDPEYGGIYWMLDAAGNVVADRKQIYAQAFAIYALAEYFRATGVGESLEFARELHALIEKRSRDRESGGYVEACDRRWEALDDMRLSDKDLNSPKSMNTHLHVLEAYTNLLRVWRDPELLDAQRALLRVMVDRIVDEETGHFRLFFDPRWNSLNEHVSFGHDIEGSWLLCEAVQVLGDADLEDRARRAALRMAEAVYAEGRDTDGSLFYEADGRGRLIDANKHWWAQAEGVVGFYNAWQLSGDRRYLGASRAAWAYIEDRVVDRVHGEWHAKLSPAGHPLSYAEDRDACLAGPWKCPYHNSRVCFEMLERLHQ